MVVAYMDKKLGILCSCILAGVFIAGILIGHFGISSSSPQAIITDKFEDKQFVSDVLDKVDSNKIRDFLKVLSDEPHIAAKKRDK